MTRIRRRAIKKWQRAHSDRALPSRQMREVSEPPVRPEDVRLIIFPDLPDSPAVFGTESVPAGPGTLAQRKQIARAKRKQLKRALRAALAGLASPYRGIQNRVLAPHTSRSRRRRLQPVGIASSAADPPGEASIRSMDPLGVALGINLPQETIAALQASGAAVVENHKVELIEGITEGIAAATRPGDWYFAHIGLTWKPEAGRGAFIGFLDSGVDTTHPAFSGRGIRFQAFDVAGKPCDAAQNAARDFGEHGTHVAAIAAGNGMGIAPRAQIAMAAVLTEPAADGRVYGHAAQIIAGLRWLVEQAATSGSAVQIINASLAGRGADSAFATPFQQAASFGILVIAAAGNDARDYGGNPPAPGRFDYVLSVGATDHHDVVADFSNWGTVTGSSGQTLAKPDISAPGVNIRSAGAQGSYKAMSGTSMAAPIVAGVAARRGTEKPGSTPSLSELRNMLLRDAKPVSPPGRGGVGRIDGSE